MAKTPQAQHDPCVRRGTNLDSLPFPGPEPFPQPATTVEHPPIPIDLPLPLPHTDSSTPHLYLYFHHSRPTQNNKPQKVLQPLIKRLITRTYSFSNTLPTHPT